MARWDTLVSGPTGPNLDQYINNWQEGNAAGVGDIQIITSANITGINQFKQLLRQLIQVLDGMNQGLGP